MKQPPAAATWLLTRLAPSASDSLLGDLQEEYESGRSPGWYWRQTLRAVVRGLAKEIVSHPFLGLRAITTGWIALLIFFSFGDLFTEAIAKLFWGWTRDIGYGTAYWWPFHVSATVVSYAGFAISTLAVVRLHRDRAMPMVIAYLVSTIAALAASAAIIAWLDRPTPVPHTLFYFVSVGLPHVWRSGFILVPLVIVLAGLLGTFRGSPVMVTSTD
jgi:hypothetical protein